MGDVWTDQPLGFSGAESGLTKIDLDWSPEEMVIEYGFGERRYLKNTQLDINVESDVCAVGLEVDAGGLGGSGDITEVSATYNEQHTDPQLIPRFPAQDIETGVRLMKTGTTCLVFTGVERQFTVAGTGVPPIPETALGDYLSNYVTKAFLPAHVVGSSFSIEIPTSAQITAWQQSKPRDDQWTWNISATYLEPNASPSNVNILEPPTEVEALIPTDMIGMYSNTLRMAKGKNSRATSTWALTLYPTD